MLCVLFLRRSVLFLVTICLCAFSDSLRAWVTQYGSTGVRATTSLRGERAHLTMLILSPPNGFLSRSLFHNSPLSFGNEPALLVPTILAVKSHSLAFCAASWECAASHRPHRGMGKEESGGLGEKTRKGKGDCSRAAPLPLGCLPKTTVNPYCVCLARKVSKIRTERTVAERQRVLSRSSTQTIRKHKKANDHKNPTGRTCYSTRTSHRKPACAMTALHSS